MAFKRIIQFIKRHPFFYKTRFKLLSRNTTWDGIESLSYNDFNTPDELPANYKHINERIFNGVQFNDELQKVKHLCLWLRKEIKGGPGLSLPSDEALDAMLNGKGGVCSDFAQVFNNFCVLNNIKVREWGMTRIPFDNQYGGHSINEVYVSALKKWVCIDVYLCLLFYSGNNKPPLSVMELQHELIEASKQVNLECFTELNDEINKSILKNYKSANGTLFLIHRYQNRIYDAYLKRLKPFLPTAVIHFIIYLKNSSYLYLFPHHDCKQLFVKN